jgi:hypothetical protein
MTMFRPAHTPDLGCGLQEFCTAKESSNPMIQDSLGKMVNRTRSVGFIVSYRGGTLRVSDAGDRAVKERPQRDFATPRAAGSVVEGKG